MKCKFCKFAPPFDAEGYQDECPHFETHGTTWKDGQEGCTISFQTLEKEYNRALEYQSRMGCEMALDLIIEQEHIDENDLISNCSHMIGYRSKFSRVHKRNGRVFYHAYRNYWYDSKPRKDLEALVSSGLASKRETKEGIYYWLTRFGLDWLGNQLKIVIKEVN